MRTLEIQTTKLYTNYTTCRGTAGLYKLIRYVGDHVRTVKSRGGKVVCGDKRETTRFVTLPRPSNEIPAYAVTHSSKRNQAYRKTVQRRRDVIQDMDGRCFYRFRLPLINSPLPLLSLAPASASPLPLASASGSNNSSIDRSFRPALTMETRRLLDIETRRLFETSASTSSSKSSGRAGRALMSSISTSSFKSTTSLPFANGGTCRRRKLGGSRDVPSCSTSVSAPTSRSRLCSWP